MGIAMPGGARRPVVPPSFACPAGDKALTPPWLGQDGSLGVVRSLARGSPGPLRSEPSTRDRGETFRLPERRSGVGRLFGSTAVSPPKAGSGPEGSRAEPLLRGRLLGKGRLLEPKSPAEQNSRLRAGIEKETEGLTLVSTRHSAPAIPIALLQVALMRPDVFPSV